MRTRPLRITVYPSRFEDVNLPDYVQHLSYRGNLWPVRVYDFPSKQHGSVTAISRLLTGP